MAGPIEFSLDISDLSKGLKEYSEKLDIGLEVYTRTAALSLEAYAKQKAPWTDRTGEARKRLTARAQKIENLQYQITLSHGVDYGKWLELANEKKYAIIQPTLRLKTPEVVRGMKILLGD